MKTTVLVAPLLLMACACFAQGAASVIFASGNAQIVGRDGQARAAARGAELAEGETVDTADGRVQLRFRDGASMSLQSETHFRVDEFRFAEQNGKAGIDDRGFYSLLKGGFRTLTGLIGKEQREQYKVDAVVAVIGIRGTDYAARLSESGLSLSTFGGLVEVCSDAGCAQIAPGETFVVADRNSLPRQQGQGTGGAPAVPGIPGLPPPIPVESPEITSPIRGPNYSPPPGSVR